MLEVEEAKSEYTNVKARRRRKGRIDHEHTPPGTPAKTATQPEEQGPEGPEGSEGPTAQTHDKQRHRLPQPRAVSPPSASRGSTQRLRSVPSPQRRGSLPQASKPVVQLTSEGYKAAIETQCSPNPDWMMSLTLLLIATFDPAPDRNPNPIPEHGCGHDP